MVTLPVPGLAGAALPVASPGPEPPHAFSLAAQPDSNACIRRVLAQLGWVLVDAEDGSVVISHHADCMADSAAALTRRSGASHAVLSSGVSDLLHSPASHCAFSMRLGEATRRAVDRLVANDGFRFTSLQTGWIGFGVGGPQRDGWQRVRSFGRGFQPLDLPSRAIEGWYSGTVRAECGVGRQIAQYASLYELFGRDGFDASFASDEIVVGTFNQLHTTDSVLLGRQSGEFFADGEGRKTASLGAPAWNGLPGFIVHVFERSTLDDVNNQAENFVVYRVSDEAAEALRLHGGFDHYNHQTRQLWELARRSDLTAQRIFERLLYERDAELLAAISPQNQALIVQMQTILSDPFFQGFEVYVHPKGVKPVAYHFARLLDRNPRTPFRIELALHNLHTTIYARWIEHLLAQCEQRTRAAE